LAAALLAGRIAGDAELTLFSLSMHARQSEPTALQSGSGSEQAATVWIEDKFDGIRAQIHCAHGAANLSRPSAHGILS
jgi:ATP-dependent DNA ligase